MTRYKSFAIALLFAACGGGSGGGGPSPREGCEEAAVALCGRLYTCFSAAELADAGYPPSEAACVTMTQTAQGCAAETLETTCTGNQKYHPNEANTCIDQIEGLACSQIRDVDLDVNTEAPACGKVCAIPG